MMTPQEQMRFILQTLKEVMQRVKNAGLKQPKISKAESDKIISTVGLSNADKLRVYYPNAPEDFITKCAKILDEAQAKSLAAETFSTGYSIQAADEVRALMKDYINEQD